MHRKAEMVPPSKTALELLEAKSLLETSLYPQPMNKTGQPSALATFVHSKVRNEWSKRRSDLPQNILTQS